MKIGVITFSQSKDNYGQMLQCYALQSYLRGLGHNPYLIQYEQEPPDRARFKWYKIPSYLFHFFDYCRWFINNRKLSKQKQQYAVKNVNTDRKFASFLKDNMEITQLYNKKELLTNPPIADAYICGSDQIWKGDDIYYLSFAPKGSKKIAYAPSFGGVEKFPSATEQMIIDQLKSFKAISVREKSGVELCRRFGCSNVKHVVDPTLLLSVKDYGEIIEHVEAKNTIFLYLLGNPIDCEISSIYEFAHKMNKEVVYVCSQGRDDNYKKTIATVGEWLGYLSQADLVITNSFHCVVFSLLFHKQFISIPLSKGYERMNGRIEELLENSGLYDRILKDSISEIANNKADFSRFENFVETQRQLSKTFLTEALSM